MRNYTNRMGFNEVRITGRSKNHNLDLPYARRYLNSSGEASPLFTKDTFTTWNVINDDNRINTAHNKAVSKVVDELAVIENLFEAWYERREAMSMLVSSASALLKFVTNWRKPAYWRNMAKHAKKPESLPQAWIAWNFGVSPLIGSIDSALHLLCADLPTKVVKGASGFNFDRPVTLVDNGWYFERGGVKGDYYKQIRAYVSPNMNPNATLLNAAGITTPLSTAWSVIPWGWAVDYFVNVSEVLSNFEDRFPGIHIGKIMCTEYLRCSHFKHFHMGQLYYPGHWNYNPAKDSTNSGDGIIMRRYALTDLSYQLVYSFPPLGGSKAANLLSAIALTLKGKAK